MDEETQLPLARMATISKLSFWIFIGACIAIYIYNKTTTPDINEIVRYRFNETLILATAFIGLFMNLITEAIKNQSIKKVFNIFCYIFEVASIIFITLKVIFQ